MERPSPISRTEDSGLQTAGANVVGLVLAAGRSSRMGAFKPLLPFGPKTVVEICIDNLRAGGLDTIVVVIGQDDRAEQLQHLLQSANVTFAVNPDPNSEMSASIATGVRALPAEAQAVVINPVDHAAVPGEVVRRLVDERKQGALLVKPTWNQRGGHPVLVDLRFRDKLLNLDPNGGLKAFLNEQQSQLKRVEVNSNCIARDMDTWDDYRALHQEVFGSSPPKLPSGRA